MPCNFKFKYLAIWLVQLPEGCVVGMEVCSNWNFKTDMIGSNSRASSWMFIMTPVFMSGLTFEFTRARRPQAGVRRVQQG